MERVTLRSTDLPSILTLHTMFGCRNSLNSLWAFFMAITRRDTLKPPPVLPAQAPISMRSTSTVFGADGQRSKSVVPNPVVVMMEATWKKASCSALPAL